MKTVAIAILLLTQVGCASIGLEYQHTSHPLAGWPVGPSNEEDTLDTLNVVGRYEAGRFYSEIGVGYKLADGGFHGPELIFTSRIGVEIWRK